MSLKPKKVLILGSGGLKIGQAGEFDYSGSQAIKALKEEGVATILINPNIATIQTDEGMADQLYLLPLNMETVTEIIEKERPDGILLGFGGQTALNLGLRLDEAGILEKYGIVVLGTSIEAIRITEDRELFKQALAKIGVKTPTSRSAHSVDEARAAGVQIGYPLMLRSGYSLGGLGSGRIDNEEQLVARAREVLSTVPQLLIEEYLYGWKELEYEIVRDRFGNQMTVCNMENLDPMGIHTGESIVVAPSQTLSNREYFLLREIGLRVVEHLGITGECNIQFALDPKSGDYRVIEVNARLSRSSALASKATGYPLAFVAAKLSLGYALHELKNVVTKKTSAFFEPALDYIVVKMPRWDTQKLKAERKIGSEMKSVGEIMAISRSFKEALQKGLRMLNLGVDGLCDYPYEIADLKSEISAATDRRLFAIARYFYNGGSVDEVHALSAIDPWFLHQIKEVVDLEKSIAKQAMSDELLLESKRAGFSDRAIARLQGCTEGVIRSRRLKAKIHPFVKEIDTMAGECEAATSYFYLTYHGQAHDVLPLQQAKNTPAPHLVIGSGPYSIGSSVEFDWCAVNMVRALKRGGAAALMVNSNPETVSTDFDESDRLYFEELTFERIADIAEFESSCGLIVSVGGQIANNLALPLQRAGFAILGTSAQAIDEAENRTKFSSLLNKLSIDQPRWEEVSSLHAAEQFGRRVGYPLLIRPSYVLSGAAMNVIYDEASLSYFLQEAALISRDHPVVLSEFILNAKELEIDGVADHGTIVVEALSEHIENAGVHSGDATIVLPPQKLYLETIRRAKRVTRQIVAALNITGPFNIQFIAKGNAIQVIECNVRASRSFPFVSKVTGHNFIEIAAEVLLGQYKKKPYNTLDLDYVGVKCAQFSYHRLKGANPVPHVEMASTGEVACLGDNLLEAFYNAWQATDQSVRGKRLLVSIGGDKKEKLLELLSELALKGWELYTTSGTHDFLSRHGIETKLLFKASDGQEPNVTTAIGEGKIDLIINIPRDGRRIGTPHIANVNLQNTSYLGEKIERMTDGFRIRRLAVDHHIPLIANLQLAETMLQCLVSLHKKKIPVKAWSEYLKEKRYDSNASS